MNKKDYFSIISLVKKMQYLLNNILLLATNYELEITIAVLIGIILILMIIILTIVKKLKDK